MRIHLRYREIENSVCMAEHIKEVNVPQGTDVAGLCQAFGITSVARYIRDGIGTGGFNEKWVSEGSLEDGMTYSTTFGKSDVENLRLFNKI